MKVISFDELKPKKGINYVRDHLRRKCKAGEFPQPIQISSHRIGWIEEEVDLWLAARARLRDVKAADTEADKSPEEEDAEDEPAPPEHRGRPPPTRERRPLPGAADLENTNIAPTNSPSRRRRQGGRP